MLALFQRFFFGSFLIELKKFSRKKRRRKGRKEKYNNGLALCIVCVCVLCREFSTSCARFNRNPAGPFNEDHNEVRATRRIKVDVFFTFDSLAERIAVAAVLWENESCRREKVDIRSTATSSSLDMYTQEDTKRRRHHQQEGIISRHQGQLITSHLCSRSP